jgi:hypothetical protein
MIAVPVRYNGTVNRLPGINIKPTSGAIQTFIRKFNQGHGIKLRFKMTTSAAICIAAKTLFRPFSPGLLLMAMLALR